MTRPESEAGQYSNLEVDHSLPPDVNGEKILHHVEPAYVAQQEGHDEKIISSEKAHIAPALQDHKSDKVVSPSQDYRSEKVVYPSAVQKEAAASGPAPTRSILGLKRRTFFILLAVIVVVVIAAVIGGAVGGTAAARNKSSANSSAASPPAASTQYANSGLGALEYTDLNGTLHRRVYYQDNSNKIRESAWDNSTSFNAPWQVNNISDAVKPGTPITAAAGYPHANYSYALAKNVYFLSTSDEIFERQAPANNSQAWEDDNFSGLYSASNTSYLVAYWHQNITNSSQELVVLFQEGNFENGITQGRYTSNKSTSNPWVANNFGFSQPKGSAFALAPVSYREARRVTLYTVDDGSKLQQHEYMISDTDFSPSSVVGLTSESDTGFSVDQRASLAIAVQDNQRLFSFAELPECTRDEPATHLIFYTVPDRSSLSLGSWNCSSGFQDHTSEIAPLQKPNTTFLALATTNDPGTANTTSVGSTLYVMFDSGNGPSIEEWTVPQRAGQPWNTVRNVTVNFGL